MKKRYALKGLVAAALILMAGNFSVPVSKAAGWVFPVKGSYKISQYFGGVHMGIDIAASKGTTVVAAADGVVSCANPTNSYYYVSSKKKKYCSYHCGTTDKAGIHVEIKYDNGLRSEYAHMDSAVVTKGSRVYAGQVIGTVGATGNATGPHLHFSVASATGATVWNGSQKFLNPMNYLSDAAVNAGTVSYSSMQTTSVSQTNAGLRAAISNPNRRVIQTVGAYIWDSQGNLVVNYSENCGRSLSKFNQMLNVNTEAKVSLSAGQTYTWQFYARSGNNVFYSGKAQFTTAQAQTAGVTYSNLRTTYRSRTNAKLAGAIHNPGGQTITYVGAYIWDANGTLIVKYSEYCGRRLKNFNQYLNINTEAKKYLSAGKMYKYQFFAVAGGKTYYSSAASFYTSI